MPNWVINDVQILGESDKVTAFVAAMSIKKNIDGGRRILTSF